MYAIINEQRYDLNSYNVETSTGRLFLYIKNNENTCDLDDLETNIGESESIQIYEYNDELTVMLKGYTDIRHLEKQYEIENQIFIIINPSSIQDTFNSFKDELAEIKNDIPNYDNEISQLSTRFRALEDAIVVLVERITMIEEILQGNTQTQPVQEENPEEEIPREEVEPVVEENN